MGPSFPGPLQRRLLIRSCDGLSCRLDTHPTHGRAPDDWSWVEQVAKRRDGAEWTGFRNFPAQHHPRAMKKGEQAFFYHTGSSARWVDSAERIGLSHVAIDFGRDDLGRMLELLDLVTKTIRPAEEKRR